MGHPVKATMNGDFSTNILVQDQIDSEPIVHIKSLQIDKGMHI